MDVGDGQVPFAVLAFLRDALLAGWIATAVFCALTATAVALWAGVRWWYGFVAGLLGLHLGILVMLAVGTTRAVERRQQGRPAVVPAAPAPPPVGVRERVRRGWRRWTRTPPTRTEWAVAVAALLVAGGLVAATQVTWVTVSALGHGVTGFGPFAVQLGLFVVVSAVVAVVCALGVLRWRSAWWPVLLAWCGTWWALVAVEALRAEGALGALNRLLRDQVRERFEYDVRPEIGLGVGWTLVLALAGAMLLLAVALLALQGRRSSHYRLVARR